MIAKIKKWVKRGVIAIVAIIILVQAIQLKRTGHELSLYKGANGAPSYRELEKELQITQDALTDAETEVRRVQMNERSVKDQTFEDLVFPVDGNTYVDTVGTVYYADPACTNRLGEQVFKSCFYETCQAKNGLTVYAMCTNEGVVVYSTTIPEVEVAN